MQTLIFGTIVLIFSIITFTNLDKPSLFVVIFVQSMAFMGIIYRMIPAQVLISGVPDQSHRGSFMAVNSSIQQIAGGIGAAAAGMIVTQNAQGVLEHYDTVGYVAAAIAVATLLLMALLNKIINEKKLSVVKS